MPAPRDAVATGVAGDTLAGVHDVKLPALVARVRCDQRLHNVLGRPSLGQQLQAVDAVIWVDQCLGRDRAKPGSDMRDAGADREEACRNGNSELPG